MLPSQRELDPGNKEGGIFAIDEFDFELVEVPDTPSVLVGDEDELEALIEDISIGTSLVVYVCSA